MVTGGGVVHGKSKIGLFIIGGLSSEHSKGGKSSHKVAARIIVSVESP